MRTIVLGAGTTGTQLAKRLTEEGHDLALIERDPDAARIAANALDCLVVQGDGSSPEILAKAGAAKARNFIALSGSDELNIVCCSIVAAEYPAVRRVAR
jgi:trk system potassium uptake protein TrkA